MKKNLILLLFIAFTLPLFSAPKQATDVDDDTLNISADVMDISYNFIKFNLTSALIKNFSLQYERVLSRNFTTAISFKMMPESNLPFTDLIISLSDVDDPEAEDVIENLHTSNFTVTPEVRFYTGKKKYGRGFYFSLFYRYGRFDIKGADVSFEDDAGDDIELNISGNVSSHTGGLMIGAQWGLGEHMCLDWWILGPHFGVSSGDITGLSSVPLSEEEQQEVEDELNDIDIPMFSQTVNVTSDKTTMSFNGPWGGLRMGLSIGIRF